MYANGVLAQLVVLNRLAEDGQVDVLKDTHCEANVLRRHGGGAVEGDDLLAGVLDIDDLVESVSSCGVTSVTNLVRQVARAHDR